VRNGEFFKVELSDGRAAPLYTTPEMVRLEREIVDLVKNGNERRYETSMLVSPILRIRMEDAHPELSKSQLAAVDDIFLSREKIVGLDGVAGAGRQPRFQSFVKASKPRATASKDSHRQAEPLRNSLKLA
jgi:hypothetical protein